MFIKNIKTNTTFEYFEYAKYTADSLIKNLNKEYLLELIMEQLDITRDDLEKDTSWVKAKIREANIDKVLS